MEKIFRPPSLAALQALLKVAESGSFTVAARQLCLTQSAISRQVRQLEEHYRVALFDRDSRSLTDAGRDLCRVARDSLEGLYELEQRLLAETRGRPFRIRIFVSLAVRWLMPRLSSFYSANPGLELSIETVGGESVDTAGDCDAYVLYLPGGLDGRPLTPLFDEYLVPVCAPLLAGGQVPPASLEQLERHALIHGSTGRHEWTLWLRAQHDQRPRSFQHLLFNLDDLALDAAARGLGVAMTDQVLAHDSIVRGDLLVPFGEPLRTGGVYALWLRDSGAAHPACQAVLSWFERQVEQTASPL